MNNIAPLYRWRRTSWCSGIRQNSLPVSCGIRQNSLRFCVQRNSGEYHYIQVPGVDE